MEYDGDDIYCDLILNGRLPVRKVVETDNVLAFHHTQPYWPTHVMVVPKTHVSSLIGDDLPDELLAELLTVVRAVARDVAAEHGEARVMTAIGRLQHAKHLHWHVLAGDQLRASPPRADV